MASISGVSGSSTTSSLYNSVNRISGLASGLDTEGMIESLVKSYQTKINQLNQKVTKTEWKQDAYRSIISKLAGFADKYTSYTSNTNLMATGFFSSAVKVLTKGEFKDSVSASGKTSSDISLDAVHQLATAAQYRTKSNLSAGETGTIAGAGVDLAADAAKDIKLSNLSGNLKLTYGSKTVSISFNETTDVDAMNDIRNKLARDQGIKAEEVGDTEVLAELINQKLADQKITFTSGETESADKRIQAVAGDNGAISFKELGTANNGVYISGASGNVGSQLGLSDDDLKNAKEKKITTIDTKNIKASDGNKGLIREMNSFEYLAEKGATTMNMSLNGVTKQITMPKVEKGTNGEKYILNGEEIKDEVDENGVVTKSAKEVFAEKYTEALQKSVKDAFNGKVTVENKGTDGKLQLEFKTRDEGSDLIINSGVGEALGIGNTATSYLNTSKSLKDLMTSDEKGGLAGLDEFAVKENGEYVLDSKGKKQYEFKINGEKIGTYTEDTKLSTILSDINANKDAGVQVSYSQTTQNFTFTAKETGADSKIEFGEGLAQAIFDRPVNTAASIEDVLGKDFEYGTDEYNFQMNVGGKDITIYVPFDKSSSKDVTIDELVSYVNGALADNKNPENSPKAYFDRETNTIAVKDSQGNKVDVEYKDNLTKALFAKTAESGGGSYTAGQDAIFTATINGEQKYMTRSSNSVSIDGLTINMNETFNSKVDDDGNAIKDGDRFQVADSKKSVTFQGKTDSDKIVDAIKSMVSDYNTMMSEIKSAYSTMPYQKSSGTFANYEPLTDDDREGMSESAIERYEEKAKQGILFGDRSLSTLYSEMSEAFSFTNREDIDALKDMGITIGYDISSGTQSVQVDEEKLRAMLDSDPDQVANLFTKSDGIMDRMKKQLDTYAKTTGEPKGILIQQAGSPLSSMSLMNNNWQQEIDDYNTQIEKWQDKLSSQVDRYTSQFSRLEQLINQMNSQSSTLQSMLGG